jgi:hypothetical protein
MNPIHTKGSGHSPRIKNVQKKSLGSGTFSYTIRSRFSSAHYFSGRCPSPIPIF